MLSSSRVMADVSLPWNLRARSAEVSTDPFSGRSLVSRMLVVLRSTGVGRVARTPIRSREVNPQLLSSCFALTSYRNKRITMLGTLCRSSTALHDVLEADPVVGQVADFLDLIRSDLSFDNDYRRNSLSLTASENYPSKLVRFLGGARQGSFYEFAPPYEADAGEWYFPDSGAFGSLVMRLSTLGCRTFRAATFDWRPNGGSAAEQAVLLGACTRGDGFVHFAHRDGGHFALETLAEAAGIEIFHFPVAADTLQVDPDRLAALVAAHPNIKVAILDQSFKLRWQPLPQIRAALPADVLLSYDASHDGGLIAGGVLPQPLAEGADIIHGNTHKTIPGPQKAYIAFRDADSPHLQPISDWIFPHLQSNSHAELVVPLLVAFAELSVHGQAYAAQVVANARALAESLCRLGFHVSGESFGFTETHQVHIVSGTAAEALRLVADVLPRAGIRTNNIEIPGSDGRHGLRLGVQALTRRGLREDDMAVVAHLLRRVILRHEDPAPVRNDVARFLSDHPLDPLPYSFDGLYESPAAHRLLSEVFA